jgi:hypothetical protein
MMKKVIYKNREHLYISHHPEQPVVILENPENEFVTVSLGEWLTLEEITFE